MVSTLSLIVQHAVSGLQARPIARLVVCVTSPSGWTVEGTDLPLAAFYIDPLTLSHACTYRIETL
jgi:predicted Co/Zn/Cd cation transporter (cation efflux family)